MAAPLCLTWPGYGLNGSLGNQQITQEQSSEQANPWGPSGDLYADLSYETIKDDFNREGRNFVDPGFPAMFKSIFPKKADTYEYIWKRPTAVVPEAKFFVHGASRFDVRQGELEDSSFISALSGLAHREGLLSQVVPDQDAPMSGDEYCGVFRFRFWSHGNWHEVCVDDMVPTKAGALAFAYSDDNTEFWSALAEKAYAKYLGSYAALQCEQGKSRQALMNLTGGLVRTVATADITYEALEALAFKQTLICGVATSAVSGLVKGHTYSINLVRSISHREDEYQLIRVKSDGVEWSGDWSDGCACWDSLHPALQCKDDKGDGEFWMCWTDFVKHFTNLEICLLNPAAAKNDDRTAWNAASHQGSWQMYVNAGGAAGPMYHSNPQFIMALEQDDKVVIGLMQDNSRKGGDQHSIGFDLYRLEDEAKEFLDKGRLPKMWFGLNTATEKINNQKDVEVSGEFSLSSGRYLIVPHTDCSQVEADFLLRIYSENPIQSGPLDTETHLLDTALPPKPTPDDKLRDFFTVEAGEDGLIDAFELQKILTGDLAQQLGGRKCSLEACRSMLCVVDADRNGTMDFEEFQMLCQVRLVKWKDVFEEFDRDNSGDMDTLELRDAMEILGIAISSNVLSSLVLRYANRAGAINFDDFVQICCRVRATLEIRGKKDAHLDEVMMAALYC